MTQVQQESIKKNRIKLMLSIAKEKLDEQTKIMNNKKSSAYAELFLLFIHVVKIVLYQPHSNIKTNTNRCETISTFIPWKLPYKFFYVITTTY